MPLAGDSARVMPSRRCPPWMAPRRIASRSASASDFFAFGVKGMCLRRPRSSGRPRSRAPLPNAWCARHLERVGRSPGAPGEVGHVEVAAGEGGPGRAVHRGRLRADAGPAPCVDGPVRRGQARHRAPDRGRRGDRGVRRERPDVARTAARVPRHGRAGARRPQRHRIRRYPRGGVLHAGADDDAAGLRRARPRRLATVLDVLRDEAAAPDRTSRVPELIVRASAAAPRV